MRASDTSEKPEVAIGAHDKAPVGQTFVTGVGPTLMSCLRHLLSLVVLLCLASTVIAQAQPKESRVALVIGNAAYVQGSLANPVNDARAMAARLRTLGFDVILRENLKTRDIGGVYREFRSKIAPGNVALVFYAGHGIQFKGQNYFPAVDSVINSEEDVPLQSLNLSSLLDNMEEAKAGVSLVFLDACRNNPYSRSFRSPSSGLAKVEAASGTLIHYATKPGSVAADGDGKNGTYTEALLAQMSEPGIPVELMLKRVANRVVAKTKGKQEPWVEGSLRGDFYFFGPTTVQGQPAGSATGGQARSKEQIEDDFWDSIKGSGDSTSLSLYLDTYPSGRYVGPARLALSKLMSPPASSQTTAVSAPTKDMKPGAARAEEDAWRKVKAAMDVATVQQFLDDYPSGNNASLAREKLAQMKKLRSEAPAAVFYTVKPGDTLIRIGMEAGQSPSDIARWNGIKDLNIVLTVGQVLRVSPTADAVSVPSSNGDDLSLAWPSNGAVIGGFDVVKNKGLEIGGVEGDPVIAAAAGRVVYAGAGLRGYGNLIILKHNSIYLTVYAHNKTLLVREDQTVSKGQQIAEMGNSDADRTKLHFEVRKSGKFVDPSPYLPAR